MTSHCVQDKTQDPQCGPRGTYSNASTAQVFSLGDPLEFSALLTPCSLQFFQTPCHFTFPHFAHAFPSVWKPSPVFLAQLTGTDPLGLREVGLDTPPMDVYCSLTYCLILKLSVRYLHR